MIVGSFPKRSVIDGTFLPKASITAMDHYLVGELFPLNFEAADEKSDERKPQGNEL